MVPQTQRSRKAYYKKFYENKKENFQPERKVPAETRKDSNKAAYQAHLKRLLKSRKQRYSKLAEQEKETRRERYEASFDREKAARKQRYESDALERLHVSSALSLMLVKKRLLRKKYRANSDQKRPLKRKSTRLILIKTGRGAKKVQG